MSMKNLTIIISKTHSYLYNDTEKKTFFHLFRRMKKDLEKYVGGAKMFHVDNLNYFRISFQFLP